MPFKRRCLQIQYYSIPNLIGAAEIVKSLSDRTFLRILPQRKITAPGGTTRQYWSITEHKISPSHLFLWLHKASETSLILETLEQHTKRNRKRELKFYLSSFFFSIITLSYCSPKSLLGRRRQSVVAARSTFCCFTTVLMAAFVRF